MARLIIWSRRAADDLEAIAEYISHDSEVYSSSVVRKILQKTRLLAEFPFAGRIVPEFSNDAIREIFAYNYRIDADEVNIAAVIHGKRLLGIELKP